MRHHSGKANLGHGVVVKNNKRNQKDVPICSRKESERVCSETQALSGVTCLLEDLNQWPWGFLSPNAPSRFVCLS